MTLNVRSFSNQEDMQRALTTLAKSIIDLRSRLDIEKRSINVQKIRSAIQRAMAGGSLFDEFQTRGRSNYVDKKIEQQKKKQPISPADNINKIIEDAKGKLDALTNIKALLLKYFDEKYPIATKMKVLVDKLITKIKDLDEEAKDILDSKVQSALPTSLKLHTERVVKWARDSELSKEGVDFYYKVDTVNGSVSYISEIKISGVRVSGLKLNYYVYIVAIPAKTKQRFNFFISVYNEPVSVKQLRSDNYGQSFVSTNNAINILQSELDLSKNKSSKVEKVTIITTPFIEKFRVKELTISKNGKNTIVRLALIGKKAKPINTLKELQTILTETFPEIKDWVSRVKAKDGVSYALTGSVIVSPKNVKNRLIEFKFEKKSVGNPSRIFITEFYKRFGQSINPNKIDQALLAFYG